MKLTEITKKEFIQGFKDPKKRLVQQKIKELRKELKPLEWMIRSSYNAKIRMVTISVFPESESVVSYDLKMNKIVTNIAEVKDVIENKFSESKDYVLLMGWQTPRSDYLTAEIVIK